MFANIFLWPLLVLDDINQHGKIAASDASVNILKANTFVKDGITGGNGKAKAHGILMVIAWVFLASIAIIIARHVYHRN